MSTLSRRRFLTISAAALASGPAYAGAPHRWTGRALGADVSLTLHAPAAQAAPALNDVRTLLKHVEHQFSLYDPASALSRLNAAGHLPRPHRDFAALCTLCDDMHAATDGLFDPTVQPLWQALARPGTPLPGSDVIGWHRVHHGRGAVSLGHGQALTFNGIAQGFATDLVRATLARHGLTRALVNIGEFAALGGPFKLGVADPLHGIATYEILNNRARATSSPGALQLNADQQHILAPDLTRAPRWSTVSVEADSAAIADGASTAFCMMSKDEIAKAARALPGAPLYITVIGKDGVVERIA